MLGKVVCMYVCIATWGVILAGVGMVICVGCTVCAVSSSYVIIEGRYWEKFEREMWEGGMWTDCGG